MYIIYIAMIKLDTVYCYRFDKEKGTEVKCGKK